MIRVLIVDDSVTQREILRRLLAGDGQFTVVAEARDGREALAKVHEHTPDVVLMDIHMPGMDGITATREIMQHCPVPIVIASSTLRKAEVDLAMQAYEAGAVAVIEKPAGAVLLHLQQIAPALRDELIAASKSQLHRPRRAPATKAKAEAATTSPGRVWPVEGRKLGPVKAIGICASTGGPPVLLEVFAALPKPFPVPVLLVQHISRGFEEGFARWLSQSSGQKVRVAASGQPLEPGVWLAPGGDT